MLKTFTKGKKKIIEGFKNKVFPFIYGERHEHQMKAQTEMEEEGEEEFFKYIVNESKGINYFLFKHYFNFVKPSDLAKKIFKIKDKKKNNDFVEEIKNRWSKLKDKVEKTPGDEKKNESLNKILEIFKDILKFNEQKNPIRTRIKNINTKPNA